MRELGAGSGELGARNGEPEGQEGGQAERSVSADPLLAFWAIGPGIDPAADLSRMAAVNREEDMALLEFCARQFEAFDATAWSHFPEAWNKQVAAAALCLALSAEDWFGHRVALERVAEALVPGREFPSLAREAKFDYARFGPMLKARLRHACPLS